MGGRGQETGQYVQSPKESKYTGATLRRVQVVLWLEGGVPGERRLRCIRVFAETEKGLECQTHTPIPHLKPEVASASKCLLGSCCRPRLPTASAHRLRFLTRPPTFLVKSEKGNLLHLWFQSGPCHQR